MKKKLSVSKTFAIIFALFIGANGILMGISMLPSSMSERLQMPGGISWANLKSQYVEFYGAVQKTLGKRQIEDFSIFKTTYEKLVEPRRELSVEEIEAKVNEFLPIIDYLNEKEIPYLYLRSLLPIVSMEDLPTGVKDGSGINYEKLGRILDERQIQTFDLPAAVKQTTDKENLFYRTDHHWSGDAAFTAYLAVGNELARQGVVEPTKYLESSFFERVVLENGFLGSYGIKVGKLYAGKDDYVYYKPNPETDVELTAYRENGELLRQERGNWFEAYMDQDILNNPDYNNKYDAMLYGNSGINILINHTIGNSKKLLVIAHSYARPLVPYYSLLFSEVRWMDPQPGRFSENFLTYIDEYQPDYVVFLNEFEGEIIGEYRIT